ncbi:MAG: hypothetical protein DMG03_27200 [Acidobacteria bacterium]|nr:MAG: hypothetical protein DMG03_27200 [Acidobacteriota bacterium]
MTLRIRILVVDDAREHAEMVVEFLRLSETWGGAQMDIATTYEQALDAMQRTAYDVAFFDYMLGARDGLALLRDVRGKGVETPVVVLTSRGAEDVAVEIHHALALREQERQRQQAEAALRSSEERFRALVENSSDTLLLLDAEGRVTYVTPSSQRHLGWKGEDLIGHSIFDFMHPDDHDLVGTKFAEALQRPGEPITQQVRLKHSDGNWRVMDGVGVNRLHEPSVGAIVVNARDITDRRKLEDQLWHAQKMEAVGQLAGGVAHDFNNLLTAMIGFCDLLLLRFRPGDPSFADIMQIKQNANRAANLVRAEAAATARHRARGSGGGAGAGPDARPRRSVIDRAGARQPRRERTRRDAEGRTPDHRDGERRSRRVVRENARAARARAIRDDRRRRHGPGDGRDDAGAHLRAILHDQGAGERHRPRARDRLRHREAERRLHLGVQRGRTRIGVQGVFAACRFAVGGAQRDARRRRRPEKVRLGDGPPRRRRGCRARARARGASTQWIRRARGDDIHLMITDLVMPHMGGGELAKRLSAARPGMRVLFMSGYTDHEVMHRDLTPGVAFVQKPFTPEVFARKVRHVLDMQPTSSADRRA